MWVGEWMIGWVDGWVGGYVDEGVGNDYVKRVELKWHLRSKQGCLQHLTIEVLWADSIFNGPVVENITGRHSASWHKEINMRKIKAEKLIKFVVA
jgi:hypothetical protein